DMRFDYEPGDHSFTDFAGKTVPVTTRTGIVMPEIFVGCLGLSHLTYAEAVPDQSLRSWTGAHRRMFEAWGGVTRCLTIDNLKAGVSGFRDGEPVITEAFAEFGRHYGVAAVPARRNRPKDKAKVEKSVDMISTQILAALRDQTFFSLEALNAAIRQRLVQLNAAPMARTGKSRTEIFDACERRGSIATGPTPRSDPTAMSISAATCIRCTGSISVLPFVSDPASGRWTSISRARESGSQPTRSCRAAISIGPGRNT
ncbi:MAG: IS21 family transposase, partial [Rhodospirillales bacterium]|nr:IS21 family transposase [Rhodospirillales bacterium]